MKLEERKLYNQVLRSYIKNFDKYFGIKRTPKEIKIISSTEKKGIKRKMSAIKKVVIGLNILSLLFLFACGEDNVTNNNGNPPPVSNDSLVLMLDSISLYANGLSVKDTILYNVFTNNDSVKVNFSVETNCNTNDTAYVIGSIGNISISLDKSNFPNSFSYSGRWFNNNSVSFSLYLKTVSMRYLKIENIKLYKVNPV